MREADGDNDVGPFVVIWGNFDNMVFLANLEDATIIGADISGRD